MKDPRQLDVVDIAEVLREHCDDWLVPYINELERHYFQLWARDALERCRIAHVLTDHNEAIRGADS
jgi:hypothetical protein